MKEGEFMKVLDIAVTVLLIIGAVNWGLVGFFGFNFVGALFGEATAITRVIYAFVGLSGLYEAYNFTIGYSAMHHRWCDLTEIRH
jgi:uncharacterized membrane protein YuzA (DUF378 family)